MKMKDLLESSATAAYGNWELGENSLGFLSETVLDLYYLKIDDIQTAVGKLELYKLKSQPHYVLGRKASKPELIKNKPSGKLETKLEIFLK